MAYFVKCFILFLITYQFTNSFRLLYTTFYQKLRRLVSCDIIPQTFVIFQENISYFDILLLLKRGPLHIFKKL